MAATPTISAFNFASPGSVLVNAGAPADILGNSTVHVLAWVYLNSSGMPEDQKVFSIAGPSSTVLTLGIGAPGGSGPVLYPEVFDNQGNRYTFLAGAIPTDQWALLEVIWTQGGSLVGVVNGQQVQSIPVSNNPLANTNNPGNSHVGSYIDGTSFPFSGMIQSVVITNAADQSATQAFAISPPGAISNWGPSGYTLSGGATAATLSAAPSTQSGSLNNPPAPTYIGEQMPASVPGSTFQMVVPSADTSTFTMLSVSQSWQQLAEITGQPNVDTGYSVSVTTGVSLTNSQTQTLGVSLGLQAGFDIGLLSSQVNITLSYSESFTQSISVTEQTTTTKDCDVTDPPVTTTGVWWQEVAALSTFQVVNNGAPQSATVPDPVPDIYAVAYPPSNTGYLRITDAQAPAKKRAPAATEAAARG